MPKILIIISSLKGGGAERVASAVANSMCDRGHSVHVVTLSDASNDDYPLLDGVSRHSLSVLGASNGLVSGLINTGKRLRVLRNSIVDIQPDSVLSFLDKTNLLVLLAGLGLNLPIVVAERNHPPSLPMNRARNILRKYIYRLSVSVIAQTEVTAQWLNDNTNARTIDIIPNSVELPLPVLPPYVALNSVEGHPFILAAGRDSPQKGFDRMLDMFELVRAKNTDWKLVFAGPDMESDLQKRIDEKHLTSSVFCIGRVGNMSQWYEQSSVFALPSRFEGFPNVLLEAMAHGCAVISFDIMAGPADMITDGYNGVLVPDNDEQGFVRELNSLLQNAKRRDKISTNATQVVKTFSENKIMDKWESALLSSSRARK